MRFDQMFRNRLVQTIACLMALLMGAQSADAQFGRNGLRDLTNPDFDSEQVQVIGDMLGFDEMQMEFASELLVTYTAEIAEMGERVRAITDGARQEARETGDWTVWTDVMNAMGDFNDEKDQIAKRFMDDLRLILEPEQDERWDEVGRYHRRHKGFSQDGLLSGESVDVIAAVNEMELPEETMATVKPILDQYALEIDRALETRNEVYEESMSGAMELFRNQDFDEMERRFERASDEAKRVRDMNRRYARQVQNVLDEKTADRWERAFKEASFPRVYRPSATASAINTTMEFTDLSPEQFDQIEAINSEYRARVDSMKDGIAEAIAEGEENRSVTAMFGRGGRNNESSEIRDARGELRDYDQEVMSRLRALLTDEQAERLPEREDNSDWRERLPNRQGGGRDGGGRNGGGRDGGGGRPRTL